MIRILLQGRLGNQLFQVATALALGKRCGRPILVDGCKLGSEMTARSFRSQSLFKFDFPHRRAAWWRNQWSERWFRQPAYMRSDAPQLVEVSHAIDERVMGAHAPVVLEGFFQNEKYFSAIESDLCRWFDLTPWQSKLDVKVAQIARQSHAVAVHVRRSDYLLPVHAHLNVCTPFYYQTAMAHLRATVPGALFFIVSDDPDWSRSQFTESDCTIVDHRDQPDVELRDFSLISLCQHQVISNSSYSWWAAWLNRNPTRIVIAPERWTNDDSIPIETKRMHGWTTVPVAPTPLT